MNKTSDIDYILEKISYLEYNPSDNYIRNILLSLIHNPESIHTKMSNLKDKLFEEFKDTLKDGVEYTYLIELETTSNIESSIQDAYQGVNLLMPERFNNLQDTWLTRLPFIQSKTEQFYKQYELALQKMIDAKTKIQMALWGIKSMQTSATESHQRNLAKQAFQGKYFIVVLKLNEQITSRYQELLDWLKPEDRKVFLYNEDKIRFKLNDEMLTAVQSMSLIITATHQDSMTLNLNDYIVKLAQDYKDKYETIIGSVKRVGEQIQLSNLLEKTELQQISLEFKAISQDLEASSKQIEELNQKKKTMLEANHQQNAA